MTVPQEVQNILDSMTKDNYFEKLDEFWKLLPELNVNAQEINDSIDTTLKKFNELFGNKDWERMLYWVLLHSYPKTIEEESPHEETSIDTKSATIHE